MSDPIALPNQKLVTIATFPEPLEANLARTALQSAGIECWINGENANNMVPIAFTAQLQVSAADEADARSLLQQMEDAPESIETVTAAEALTEDPR